MVYKMFSYFLTLYRMRQEVLKLHEEIEMLTNKVHSTAHAFSQATDALNEHQRFAYEKEKQLLRMVCCLLS
jgi:hypothetical protein